MQRRLLLPLLCCAVVYVPLLTAAAPAPGETEMFRRSLVSTGDLARLQHVMAKARDGGTITVAVIGGSITAGAKATTP